MEFPNIFIATITSRVKDYAWHRWLSNVECLIDCYAGECHLYASDNSADNEYIDYLRSCGMEVGKVNPNGRPSTEVLCESFNQVRNAFLKSGCDYLCIIESDVVPPHNALARLVAWRLPIVSALYFSGKKERLPMAIQGYESNNVYKTKLIDLSYFSGKVQPAFASGLGCAMISREVVSKIKFRTIAGVPMHPDAIFYQDLRQVAHTQHFIDTSILCKHYNQDWNQHIHLTKKIG